jgi:lipoate-protein ligase A
MDEWRLIWDGPLKGAANMARDEALFCGLEGGFSPPTLRLYGWSGPTVSIGAFQDARPFACGLPLVRRPTGGKALLHHMELTYSFTGPTGNPFFSGGLAASYHAISRLIVEALRKAGVPAEFSKNARRSDNPACFFSPARHEVSAGGRKIVASAQKRSRRAFLQHGSIILAVDTAIMAAVFGEQAVKRTNWVGAYSDITAKRLGEFIVEEMEKGFGVGFRSANPSEWEMGISEALESRKYRSDCWTFERKEKGFASI